MAEEEKPEGKIKSEDKVKKNPFERGKNLAKDEDVAIHLGELYNTVSKAFDDKTEQNETVKRGWDMFNCEINDQQSYNGTAQVYLPIVRDAIEALVTRFRNTMFPNNGNYSDVTAVNGTKPYETISMLNHYVEVTDLRENIVPALIRNAYVGGQYTLMTGWREEVRYVTKKIKKSAVMTEDGVTAEGDDQEVDVVEEEVKIGMPDVQVIDSRDLVIIPANVDDIKHASIVAIALHLTKEGVKQRVRDGEFDDEEAEELLKCFDQTQGRAQQPDTAKDASSYSGVKVDGKSKTAVIYMVWSMIKIDDEERRCVSYLASPDGFLSCKRNPYWNDKVPIISKAAVKIPNSVWGKSRTQAVEKLQYSANDFVNMGMDSAQFTVLPLVMTDPLKNPRVGSMIMTMAAIWETSPNDTKFVDMPQFWKEAFSLVSACRDQIMQSLGTNPSMLPHRNSTKKPTQAEIAQEQQVALESTSDSVSVIQSGILDTLLEWFYDLDYQYRDQPLTVKRFGQIGTQSEMQEIEPIQVGTSYVFKWYGTEAVKSVQQVQQQIAAMNVLRGIPPEQLNGRKIDLGPILENLVEVAFGPRIAPNVLIDQRHQLSMEAGIENQLMRDNFPVSVQPLDNDAEHIQQHQAEMQMHGDPAGLLRLHIMAHVSQMNMKAQAANPSPKGQPGMPGGAAPGTPGTPRIGAQPGQARPMQAPPGAIHQDQIVDPSRMPR